MDDFKSTIPVVKYAGAQPTMQSFGWRTNYPVPNYELWWEGPLPLQSPRTYTKADRDCRFVFVTCIFKGETNADNVIEIRRGGGLHFELSVLLEFFVILHLSNKELL